METIKAFVHEATKLKVPIFDFCRALIEKGKPKDSRLEFYRARNTPDIIIPNIGEGAKWTIREDRKRGPEFRKYEEMPKSKIEGPPLCPGKGVRSLTPSVLTEISNG